MLMKQVPKYRLADIKRTVILPILAGLGAGIQAAFGVIE